MPPSDKTVTTADQGDSVTKVTGDSVVTRKTGPSFWFVKMTHPNHHGRTVFRSVSEKRARAWLVNRCPRGSEFHLESPSGDTFSYEAERAGEEGADAEQWMDFDPSTWTPVEVQAPPGDHAWSDREG